MLAFQISTSHPRIRFHQPLNTIRRHWYLRDFSVRIIIPERRVRRVIALADTVAVVRVIHQGVVWRWLPKDLATCYRCLGGAGTRFTEFEYVAEEGAEEG